MSRCLCRCPKCGEPDSVDQSTCTCGCHECTSDKWGYYPKKSMTQHWEIVDKLLEGMNGDEDRATHYADAIQEHFIHLIEEEAELLEVDVRPEITVWLTHRNRDRAEAHNEALKKLSSRLIEAVKGK